MARLKWGEWKKARWGEDSLREAMLLLIAAKNKIEEETGESGKIKKSFDNLIADILLLDRKILKKG
jgi:hypothetical protein